VERRRDGDLLWDGRTCPGIKRRSCVGRFVVTHAHVGILPSPLTGICTLLAAKQRHARFSLASQAKLTLAIAALWSSFSPSSSALSSTPPEAQSSPRPLQPRSSLLPSSQPLQPTEHVGAEVGAVAVERGVRTAASGVKRGATRSTTRRRSAVARGPAVNICTHTRKACPAEHARAAQEIQIV